MQGPSGYHLTITQWLCTSTYTFGYTLKYYVKNGTKKLNTIS